MTSSEYSPVDSPDTSTVFEYHDLSPMTTAEVYQAHRTVAKSVSETMMVRSEWLSEKYDADVYFKREDTLPTGSFKIRGAVNLFSNLDVEFLDRGVITASTGNYGRAIAWAADRFDTSATIAVPETAGQYHIEGIERLGADVTVIGSDYDEARVWAEQQAAEQGYRYAHPGNERHVIAGAGTGGLEIAETLPGVDAVFCPVGAGSIGAGYSLSVGTVTDARVIGVQSASADAVYRAWQTGEFVTQAEADTFAEGIGARVPFAVPLKIMRKRLDDMVTVTETELIAAAKSVFMEERILVEGASAVPLAALEQFRDEIVGKTIVIPITGRNIPSSKIQRLIQGEGE